MKKRQSASSVFFCLLLREKGDRLRWMRSWQHTIP